MLAAGSHMMDDFQPVFDLKRKRRLDEEPDTEGSFLKRPNLTQLPIRLSPPSRPSLTFASIPGPSRSRTYGELHSSPFQQRSAESDVSSSDNPTNTTPPARIGRARSNDLMSPARAHSFPHPTMNLLYSNSNYSSMAQAPLLKERVPTPMASAFSTSLRSPFDKSFSSHLRPLPLQTSLSPMVDAESWTPQSNFPPSPSPDSDGDVDTNNATPVAHDYDLDTDMMDTEDSHTMSSSFGALSVASAAALENLAYRDLSPTRRGFGNGSATEGERRNGRVPRLQMGFRADCERCLARVPGHYSHILWS